MGSIAGGEPVDRRAVAIDKNLAKRQGYSNASPKDLTDTLVRMQYGSTRFFDIGKKGRLKKKMIHHAGHTFDGTAR